MTVDELETIKIKLMEQLQEEQNRRRRRTAEADDLKILENGDSVDLSENERNRNLSIKLSGRKDFYTKKIIHALRRIEEGTYGDCDDCGDSISFKRLLARPTASLCIGCKEEQEHSEVQVNYQHRSHTRGKVIEFSIDAMSKLKDEDIKNTQESKLKLIAKS